MDATVTRAEAFEMLKTVDGPFSTKVKGSQGFTKHTAVSRETLVRAATFHEWNEFTSRDMRSFGAKPKVLTGGCVKCGGTGYLAHFSSTERGICFRCNGTGKAR